MVASQALALGQLTPWSTEGDYNVQYFAIQQAISKLQTATAVLAMWAIFTWSTPFANSNYSVTCQPMFPVTEDNYMVFSRVPIGTKSASGIRVYLFSSDNVGRTTPEIDCQAVAN